MRLLSLTALGLVLATVAGAAELNPRQAHSLDLGPVRGSAYYTVETDGLRVVATLAPTDAAAATPLRVITTLASDQVVSFSVPGTQDGAAASVAFARRGNRVEVASTGY
ncbi:hypothetical protein DA075_08885 [Methylobacterium currus]|uniref:Uncharacterized protein n=1 Tax=Methylobacterium currus TaxID=2051553 RepID=A0A2R4WHJ6_9HYPH|nr:hypothetical protein [Methylobacterium currus]AWB21003.1 hypothetical protein DA075_08885 [Methylobacterium currus]UHC14168.1 hypothetical protein LRS73_16455 [Methylobacterium currus]